MSAIENAPTESVAPLGRRRRTRATSAAVPWIFVFPALTLTVLIAIAPTVYTIALSFFSTKAGPGLLGTRTEVFVGFGNFIRVIENQEFWNGMARMLLYGVIMAPITICLGLLFALLVDSGTSRLSKFSRVVIFLPYAVPGVLSAIMWGFLYLPGVSPIVAGFKAVGLPAPDLFSDSLIYSSLANIGIWGAVGFNMVIMYTALKSIPSELIDAARLDGCSGLQVALRIKLPMIAPAVSLTSMFVLIGALQVYSEPQTMRPLSNTVTPTFMPMMTVYNQAFSQQDLHGAAATALVIVFITVTLSAGVFFGLARGRRNR